MKIMKRMVSALVALCVSASVIPNVVFAGGVTADEMTAPDREVVGYNVTAARYYKDGNGDAVLQKNEYKYYEDVKEITSNGGRDNYVRLGFLSAASEDAGKVLPFINENGSELSAGYSMRHNDVLTELFIDPNKKASSSDEVQDIYLDPMYGSDSNSGYSDSDPVQTLDKAKELVKCYYPTDGEYVSQYEIDSCKFPNIILMNTLEVTGETDLTFDGLGMTKLMRYQGGNGEPFYGVMIKITGDTIYDETGSNTYRLAEDTGIPEPVRPELEYNTKVEIYNMIIDGGFYDESGNVNPSYISSTQPAVVVEGGELTLSYGTLVMNNSNEANMWPEEQTAAGIYVKTSSSLIMNGGAVSNNTSVSNDPAVNAAGGIKIAGVSYADLSNSEKYNSGASFVMNDGIISGNEGANAAFFGGAGGYFEINGGYISNNKSDKDEYEGFSMGNTEAVTLGNIVGVPYVGEINSSVSNTNLQTEFTPLYINGGVISDNVAETIVYAPSMYIKKATVQFNKRYRKDGPTNEMPSVIKTYCLNVDKGEKYDFSVISNYDFQSTIYVNGTAKVYNGYIYGNNVYSQLSGISAYMASGIMINHMSGDTNAYDSSINIATEIKNVCFENNASTAEQGTEVYGGGAVCVRANRYNEYAQEKDKFSSIIFENCEFKNNSAPTELDESHRDGARGGAIGIAFVSNADNEDARTINITNCTFDTNSAYQGGAIANINDTNITEGISQSNTNCMDVKFNITGSSFIKNSAVREKDENNNSIIGGGAICLDNPYNETDEYGGVRLTANIAKSVFTENTAKYQGGAVSTELAYLSISDNCRFEKNTAESQLANSSSGGGALYAERSVSLSIQNSKFSQNSAMNGGAIEINNIKGDAVVDTCDIFNNNTEQALNRIPSEINVISFCNGDYACGNGGGIYLNNDSGELKAVNINNSKIYGNAALMAGGGIIVKSAMDVNFGSTSITENTARYFGGGVAGIAGSIAFNTSNINQNASAVGGGVFVSGNGNSEDLGIHGGTVNNNYTLNYAYKGDVSDSDNNKIGRSGGGIFTTGNARVRLGCYGSEESSDEYHSDEKVTDISGNSADMAGGVYIAGGSVMFGNIKLSGNDASAGDGGGIYQKSSGSRMYFADLTEVLENTAQGCGGGIASVLGDSFALSGMKITKNTAGKGGGVYVGESEFVVNKGQITENVSTADTSVDYGGAAIYKSGAGQVVFAAEDVVNVKISGDIRTISPSVPTYQLKTSLDGYDGIIYVTAPETDMDEGTTVISQLDNGRDYIAVSGENYTITNADFKKFKYLGNEDYKLVLDDVNNVIKIKLDDNPGMTITATHTWNDGNNQDGIRPENTSVTATVYANGTLVTEDAEGNAVVPAVLTTESNTAAWENLPKYDNDKHPIEYSIKIEYAATGSQNAPVGYKYTALTNDGYAFTLSTTHITEKIDITANKVWRDDLESYGMRTQTPEEIGIKLRADGAVVEADAVDTESNARRWVYTWKDMPVYNAGTKIVYTLDEENVPSGYTKSVSSETDGEGNITYTVTNTLDGWTKTVINEAEINLPYPLAGTALSTAIPSTIGTDYRIKSCQWLRRGSSVSDSTICEAGVEYGLKLEIVPKDTDRMEFADTVKTIVNVADNAPATKSASISTDYNSIVLEWIFKGTNSQFLTYDLFADFDVLRRTDVTINPPSQDRKTDYSVPTSSGIGYYVGGAKWFNGDTELKNRFAVGIPYKMVAEINSEIGYGFGFGETNINVNGSVRTNKAAIQMQTGSSQLKLDWYFDALAEENHNVSVQAENGNVSADKNSNVAAGEKVTLTFVPDTGYTSEDAEVKITRTGETEKITLADGNSFIMPGCDAVVDVKFNKIPAAAFNVTVGDVQAGYGYTDGNILTADVKYADDSGCDDATYTYTYQWYSALDENADNGAKINGATDKTYAVPTGKDAGSYYYYCVVTAERKDNGETASSSDIAVFTVEKETISNVSAAVIEPVPQQRVGNNSGVILPLGAKYVQSAELVWMKGNDTLSADAVFDNGETYTAVVVLEPISGNYAFAENVTAKINENTATAVRENGKLKVSYGFTTPSKPESGVPYSVIENPEIVTYGYESASIIAIVNNCDFERYTYTYQWYDENNTVLENKSGNVTANGQQIILALPQGKDAGITKYYCTISGNPKVTSDTPVSGTSNNGIFIVQAKEITSVTISDISQPVAGGVPDTTASIADSENYLQAGLIAWYDGENYVGVFGGNTKYTVRIELVPDDNYVFAKTVTATVNGNAATVAAGGKGNIVVVTYDGFEKTGDLPLQPTESPTSSPTATPTSSPTVTPTSSPTTTPTSSPTATPTTSPTATPKRSSGGGGGGTIRSTPTPTPSPTPEPTPTVTETPIPSEKPTVNGIGMDVPSLNKEDHFAYMAGYPDGNFKPDGSITRAEVTVMFSRLLNQTMDSDKEYTMPFSDVPKDAWYRTQIGFMERYGIVVGYADDTFRPEQPVTRAEFVAIAAKFAEFIEADGEVFDDVDEDLWAKPYILTAQKNGWIAGYDDGTFKPQNPITRAEVVSIVNRILGRSCDIDYVSQNNVTVYNDVTDEHWAYFDVIEAANGHLYTKDPSEVWTDLLK